jgi:hypothetical protein
MTFLRRACTLTAGLLTASLAACSGSNTEDLRTYVEEIKS